MQKNEHYLIKNKTIERSLKEGAVASFISGICDNYLSPFVIALKITPLGLGLLNGIPNILGPWAELLSRNLIIKFPRKLIVILSIIAQIIFYLSLVILAFLSILKFNINPLLVVLFFAIYSFVANLSIPAWVSWIGDIVEEKKINSYFSFRNSLGVLAGLIGILLGGVILDIFKFQFNVFYGFLLIFIIGAFINLFRISYLQKMYEPQFIVPPESYFSLRDFLTKGLKTNFGRFVIINAFLIFSTNISGPFYTLYMLRDLKFSYSQYLLFLVSSSLGSFVGFYFWKRIVELIRNLNVLRIAGALIALIPILWFFTIIIPYEFMFGFILFLSLLGGFCWSAHTISTTNFFYSNVTKPKRDLCSAYSNIIYGIAVFTGSLTGGFLINILKNPYINSIMLVSLFSGILRFLSSLGFLKVKERVGK